MNIWGFYRQIGNTMVIEDFIGTNTTRICADIDNGSNKPQFLITETQLPGLGAIYVSGGNFTPEQASTCIVGNTFIVSRSLLTRTVKQIEVWPEPFTVMWALVFTFVRMYVRFRPLSIDQLLNSELLERIINRPLREHIATSISKGFMTEDLDEYGLMASFDSQIVNLLARCAMNKSLKGDNFDYKLVKRILSTTRQTLDLKWFDSIPPASLDQEP